MARIYELSDGTRTVESTGPDALKSGLEELERRVEAAGFNCDELFVRGLEAGVIRQRFASVGLTPPDELVALYEWRNGYSDAGFQRWPLADVALAPLDLVLERYSSRGDLAGTPLEITTPLVILEADDRGHAVLCDAPPHEPPRVLEFAESNQVNERWAPVGLSICTWVASWTLAIDMGRWVRSGTASEPFWTYDPSTYPAYEAARALP